MKRVYLDNAASAPLDRDVIKMLRKVERLQGNPQGANGEARWSLNRLQWARWQVATSLNCDEDEIFFCSGATEANNLAKKLWKLSSDAKVHDSLRIDGDPRFIALIGRKAFNKWRKEMEALSKWSRENKNGVYSSEEEFLRVLREKYGKIEDEVLQAAKYHQTKYHQTDVGSLDDVVEAMSYINNETGEADGRGVPYARVFMDLTATIGHIRVDLHQFPQIVGASFSGHKFGSLQGVGVLYIKKEEQAKMRKSSLPKSPWSLGGGTPNTLGIYSLGIAIKNACNGKKMSERNCKIRKMLLYIQAECDKIGLKVSHHNYMANITFRHLDAQTAVSIFSGMGVDISAGSACHSDVDKPSQVLLASGYSEEDALKTVRISLSGYNTWRDIKTFCKKLRKVVEIYDVL